MDDKVELIDPVKIKQNIDNKILTKYKKNEIAEIMNIRPQTLGKILDNLSKGKNITITTLNKIAEAGKIDCKELLT